MLEVTVVIKAAFRSEAVAKAEEILKKLNLTGICDYEIDVSDGGEGGWKMIFPWTHLNSTLTDLCSHFQYILSCTIVGGLG